MQNIGFFNGEYEYGQDEFSTFFKNICSSGISKSNDVYKSFDMTKSDSEVKVDTGYAILDGFYFCNSEIKSIKIDKPKQYARVDRIVIRLSKGISNNISIESKLGKESLTPIPPDISRDKEFYELSLARVNVPIDGKITIVDERGNEDLCGFLIPKKGRVRNVFIQNNKPSESESVSGTIWIQVE